MSLAMNPQVREWWCAALRSGGYQQARGALRRLPGDPAGEGYCCLGVLTDLWLKAGHGEMIPDLSADDPGASPLVSVWDDPAGVLPRPVMEWAGLASANPELKPGLVASLLNDDGCTFAEIADLIDGTAS